MGNCKQNEICRPIKNGSYFCHCFDGFEVNARDVCTSTATRDKPYRCEFKRLREVIDPQSLASIPFLSLEMFDSKGFLKGCMLRKMLIDWFWHFNQLFISINFLQSIIHLVTLYCCIFCCTKLFSSWNVLLEMFISNIYYCY